MVVDGDVAKKFDVLVEPGFGLVGDLVAGGDGELAVDADGHVDKQIVADLVDVDLFDLFDARHFGEEPAM